MNRISSIVTFTTFAMGAGIVGFTGGSAQAAVVVEYDASTAASNPTAESDWEPSPESGANMTLSGGLLHQNNAAGDASAYRSKAQPGLMVRNTTNYTVQFTSRVLLDTPNGDWYTNTALIWGDNTQSYSVTLAKTGSSGSIKTGSGTTYAGLSNVITGIDWSVAHQIDISYIGASDEFNIYLDGSLVNAVAANGLLNGSANVPEPYFMDRVIFGDRLTSGGGATQTDWTSIRLLNEAVPEPASIATLALVGGAGLLKRRRA
jgi:hypothetical protein